MKGRLYTLILLLILATTAKAQYRMMPMNQGGYDHKAYHFGFTLGLNSMNFLVRTADDFIETDTVLVVLPFNQGGFFVGIVSDMRIRDNLNLRFVPGLVFGDRSLHYQARLNGGLVADYSKNVESTYLDFPVYIKFKTDRVMDGNYRGYVLGGFKYSLDLASQSKKHEDNTDVMIKLKKNDLVLELGTGFDFYMYYFKLGVELRYSWGIMNMLKPESNPFASSLDRLGSKIFSVGLTFE